MIIGRPKARVLPEPVGRGRGRRDPARASGIVAAWIGNGVGDAVAGEPLDEARGHTEGGEAVVLGHLLGLALRAR